MRRRCGKRGSTLYQTTRYFDDKVLAEREYVTLAICISVIENPVRRVLQDDGRIRHWAYVDALGGRALRVVTLSDGETIHNAFLDRGFRL
jgi:hypothetical protein